jgi:hypothetical protein
MKEGLMPRGRWEILRWNGTPTFNTKTNQWEGDLVSHEVGYNKICNNGRDELLKLLFGLSGTDFEAGGVGDSTTATSETHDRLQNELITGTTRKALTDASGGALGSADIAAGTLPYFRELTVMWEYPNGDALDGETFAEFALFSTNVLPGTPTGTSGIMFNRFLATTPFVKDTNQTVQVKCTIEL